MSLAERLATPPAPKGSKTILDRWIDTLEPEDYAAVEAALKNPDWRHTDLQRLLESAGAPKIADTTFGAWRRKRTS